MFFSTAAASASREGGGPMVEEMTISSVPPQVSSVHVEDAVEAAAVMVAASGVLPMVAASFIPAVELAVTAALRNPDSIFLDNALQEILSKNQVHLTDPTAMDLPRIEDSIASLDGLIRAVQQNCDETRWVSIDHASSAPGFETANHLGTWAHRGPVLTPYQTLESVNRVADNDNAVLTVPMVSPKVALGYYIGIRAAWEERRRWAESVQNGRSHEQVCSCIREWQHAVGGDTLNRIGNQVLEQAMIQEVHAFVSANLNISGLPGRGMAWDLRYTEDLFPKPEAAAQLYVQSAMVRVLSGRDEYVATVATNSLSSATSVDVATCYVFYRDPAHRYILIDLLPYIARKGIQVRVLVDLMTVESAIIKSVFCSKHTNKATTSSHATTRSGVDPMSFLNVLPEFAPPFGARSTPSCPRTFLEQLLAVAAAIPNNKFQIRWWCARDSETGYRIKNHAKCYSFDSGSGGSRSYAIIGGSNVAPSIDSGDSDCDLLVNGCVAARVAGTFNYLWDQLITKTADEHQSACSVPITHSSFVTPSTSMSSDDLVSYLSDCSDDVDQEQWSDANAAIAVIRSTPSSAGEDIILRHVIGAISAASQTVDICMGHSNKPLALAWALRNATERGVKVRFIVNSIYSCDLRVNQRDLFLSVRQLLEVAPDVEVWATAMPSMRQRARIDLGQDIDAAEEGMHSPPFIHAKYVVIDSRWVAVGSWNLWHRSAFHEIEHELLIESKSVAALLTEKFDKERRNCCVRIMSVDECTPGKGFCPLGCSLCQSFGPFYS